MKKHLLAALAAGTTLALAGSAHAGAGRQTVDSSDTIIVMNWTQSNLNSTIVETDNLVAAAGSSAADTVIHAFPKNQFSNYSLGNDDQAAGDLRSRITIPGGFYNQEWVIVVRAYNSTSRGSGTLRFRNASSNSTLATYNMAFGAGARVDLGTYAAGMHALTVEKAGGQSDTAMLLLRNNASTASAYDDNTGLGLMSYIHANEACTSGCYAVVARPAAPGNLSFYRNNGQATLVWDPDMHVAGSDSDGDGLSATLEAAIGTSGTVADSDKDGINDGLETIGGNEDQLGANWPLLRLPFMGVDPLKKDVLVQADYIECTWDPASNDSKNGCRFTDNEGEPTADRWQMNAVEADIAAKIYSPTPNAANVEPIAVHFDAGPLPTSPFAFRSTSTLLGSWGGAARHTKASWLPGGDDAGKCQFRMPTRKGIFHFLRLEGEGSGQASYDSQCFGAILNGATVAHELGHNLHLAHEPNQSTGDYSINYQPNYDSIMNYRYTYDQDVRRFADGRMNGWDLNANALSEAAVTGPTIADRLILIKKFGFPVVDDANDPRFGSVDWDRDGEFSGNVVKGTTAFADMGNWKATGIGQGAGESPWEPGTGIAWGANRLIWVARRNGALEVRTTTAAQIPGMGPGETPWTTAPAPPLTNVVTTPAVIADDAGVVHVIAMLNDGSIVAYKALAQPNGSIAWTFAKTIKGPGAPSVTPSASNTGERGLVAVRDGYRRLKVFVTTQSPTDGLRLQTYDWDQFSNSVTGPNLVTRVDGSPIVPDGWGIGATRGYAPESTTTPATEGVVLIVPEVDYAISVGSKHPSRMHLYRLLAGGAYELSEPVNERTAEGQPSIAYVPTDPSVPSAGRFYITFRNSAAKGSDFLVNRPFRIAMTQGNGPTAPTDDIREFAWTVGSANVGDTWRHGRGNVPLLYDATFFPRLQAASTFYPEDFKPPSVLKFYPYMDNIVPGTLRSQSDWPRMLGALQCSLNSNVLCRCETTRAGVTCP